jgi:hypothetical protein
VAKPLLSLGLSTSLFSPLECNKQDRVAKIEEGGGWAAHLDCMGTWYGICILLQVPFKTTTGGGVKLRSEVVWLLEGT